jgi:Copper type II ascorbate-dependent monooxygenase, C-terminal domain
VTVIREHLHMHVVGASMSNSQIRDGQVIHQGIVEYWDFSQQGNIVVQQPSFEIQPGDAFRTVCNYNVKHNETWGVGSDNEMCMAFLYYYPRHVVPSDYGDLPLMCGPGLEDLLPDCVATHEATPDFAEARQLGRVFGTESNTCDSATPSNPSDGPGGPSNPSSSAMETISSYFAAGVIGLSLLASW